MTNREVTEAMIEAGVAVLRDDGELDAAWLPSELVTAIYLAMSRASQPVDTGVDYLAAPEVETLLLDLEECHEPVAARAIEIVKLMRKEHRRLYEENRAFGAKLIEAESAIPLDSEAVERVARALHAHEWAGQPKPDNFATDREYWIAAATAALTAMKGNGNA